MQKAERRTVTDARFVAWLYSYNREEQEVCFDVLRFFYLLPTPHPLSGIDKEKMDWIDFFPA